MSQITVGKYDIYEIHVSNILRYLLIYFAELKLNCQMEYSKF